MNKLAANQPITIQLSTNLSAGQTCNLFVIVEQL